MTQQLHNFVNGQHQPSNSGRFGTIYNPATGEVCAEVDLSSAAEANGAVEISAHSQKAWAKVALKERLAVLKQFGQLLEQNLAQCSELIVQEHGKPLSQAEQELTKALEVIGSLSALMQTCNWSAQAQNSKPYAQPLGVCVGITTSLIPALSALWLFPIALCCGNSFILKPSERTPSIALKFAELLQQAGLPDGLFQVIQGDKEVVDALISHPQVMAVSFIGSTHIAKAVYRKASDAGKRVQALGSAKNHLLVADDADLQLVSDELMNAAFSMSGQNCMAASVVVTTSDAIADALIERLIPRIQALKIGPGNAQPENDMGPLISEAQLLKVRGYIEQGEKDGAQLLVDGRELNYETGYFVGGSLFDQVSAQMRIYREEILGPIILIMREHSYEQALSVINSHPFANSSAIFTNTEQLATDFCQRVETGNVGLNVALAEPAADQSISGWKQSLFGPLGVCGPDGQRFFTRQKSITKPLVKK